MLLMSKAFHDGDVWVAGIIRGRCLEEEADE